ncbi:YvrJ family protein [Tepidibacter hydrothermalis]|uniref:YvrJ family protein n=1 Tax=Tepidibacter hydrothermalis TaxID=3036126 RepID=A0ABY8ECA4_9FIRM|nr:YvrJ family protein [Tepidibacter hydrothermalis]WFD10541.1 YvrJ family protein [Tepidibacter hydrothermalis]
MNELLGLVSNVGFPIVLSIYLLTRIEEKLENLTQSINKLNNVISRIETK